jgi:N6-L-threonylcarbamoyladenine synthase/protein kinase Bud32
VRVLGIEGTAWAASAAVFETDTVASPGAVGGTGSSSTASTTGSSSATATTSSFGDPDADHFFVESDAYQPDSGGIHPREAAEHMGEAIPRVVAAALEHARERARARARTGTGGDGDAGEHDEGDAGEHDEGDDGPPIDAVAFSRGPGLGPCLRIVATAARALAGRLDVPLVGVNHMVAHLEVGRYFAGFDAPVCLNASGANAHLLGFHDGRYRVLGETMDTGVGNAIDKFTRHVGWSHPGGPKVEAAAREGDYVELPYVVKGMDFSFSGIMSAAKDRYDDGVPVEDVCRGLEETVFAMLTEVSERALSLTGTDELVLGGGVGQNERLRGMLAEMCAARGADFYAPPAEYLRDNAGMIALLGARMYAAGDTLAIPDSAIDPNFRPDQVPVTWRAGESVARGAAEEDVVRGAEATVELEPSAVSKRRVPKEYRHPTLDGRLRRERTVAEARLIVDARRQGVPTPLVYDVDPREGLLRLQRVGDRDLATGLSAPRCRTVGAHLARLHAAGLVHGDPTTRNVRVDDDDGGEGEDADDAPPPADATGRRDGSDDAGRVFLIDFGLGFHSGHVEDHAMDLHVFEQSIGGTADAPGPLIAAFEDGYAAAWDGADAVLARLRDVEGRGRYQ